MDACVVVDRALIMVSGIPGRRCVMRREFRVLGAELGRRVISEFEMLAYVLSLYRDRTETVNLLDSVDFRIYSTSSIIRSTSKFHIDNFLFYVS